MSVLKLRYGPSAVQSRSPRHFIEIDTQAGVQLNGSVPASHAEGPGTDPQHFKGKERQETLTLSLKLESVKELE